MKVTVEREPTPLPPVRKVTIELYPHEANNVKHGLEELLSVKDRSLYPNTFKLLDMLKAELDG